MRTVGFTGELSLFQRKIVVSALYNTRVVLPHDRVKTKSGRHGVVKTTSRGDVAHVLWDDGEEFPIKFCHLEVLAHGYSFPQWYTRRGI